MERLMTKQGTDYTTDRAAEALQRLGRLEDMYEAVCAELEQTIAQMQTLSASGKTKSATYRQLFGNKLTLQGLLSRFEVYGVG